jgi:hypothetical protein
VLPYNRDADWDALAVNDFGHINGPHQLFLNQGNSTFSLSPISTGLDVEMFGMGIAPTDINHDGIVDIAITNIGNPVFLVSDGVQNTTWVNMAARYGLFATEERTTCWGIDWHDVNNDGHEDLWMGCGPLPIHGADSPIPNPPNQPDALYLWENDTFVDVSSAWGIDSHTNTRGGGFADLDGDGCWELLRVPRDGEVEIFRPNCPIENQWVDIRLHDGIGNNGIGATVTVYANQQSWTDWMVGGGASFSTFFPQELHFGLGTVSSEGVDVQVQWADGSSSLHPNIPLQQKHTLYKP